MQNEHPPATRNDEISLSEFWKILVRRKWWVLGTPFLAVIVAIVAVTAMRPQWEATAAIRIGAVGQEGQVGQAGQLIEPVARVVERVKLKSVEDVVLTDLGFTANESSPESRLYRESLTIKALPNTDLIEMKVRSYSQENEASSMGATVAHRWVSRSGAADRENAKRPLEATIAYLTRVHEELGAPTVQRLKQLLGQVQLQIDRTRAERERLIKLTGSEDKAGFMERVVAANTLIQRDVELRVLEQAKAGYEEQLGPMRTYPTSIIETISVSERPVAPKKAHVVILAGVAGLFLGVMAAFLRNALQASI